MPDIKDLLLISLMIFGCSQSNQKTESFQDSITVTKEHLKDSIIDKTFKDNFDYIHFVERIKKIREVDTLSKTNKNVKSLLLKGEHDSSIYYIIKVGVDTEYRFQTVYNFYIDSTTSKLFFLDVFNDSLIEIDSSQNKLPVTK